MMITYGVIFLNRNIKCIYTYIPVIYNNILVKTFLEEHENTIFSQ